MVDWDVVCLPAAYCGSNSPLARAMGIGQPLACAAVLQPVPISCHFQGCKAPLSSTVSGAISSELTLLLPLFKAPDVTDTHVFLV